MIEVTPEIIDFTQIFNHNEPVYRALVVNPDAVENPVPDGQYAGINSINAGVMANCLEYERRLNYFLITQMFANQAVGEYLDYIGNEWTNNERPAGYSDQAYYDYLVNKLMGLKESAVALITILTPFSSEPVLIFEGSNYNLNGFMTTSYAGYFESGKVDNLGNVITPALIGGSTSDGTGIYFFRVKLQPKDEISERLIIIFLSVAHCSGIGYEIEYYYTPSWH